MITELAAFATALSGSEDSAAAIVAISAPTIEKITATTPTVIAATPNRADSTRTPRGGEGGTAKREDPAVPPQVGEVHRLVRPQAENKERAERDEHDDRGHLDTGEPELELTERRHREQVGRRHQDQQHQRGQPQRDVDPELDDLRTGDRLEAHDDHPEIPVQPAHRETGPVAKRVTGVV